MKLVSVIVTNYNGQEYLKACLESLFDQSYPSIEIILSDDASSDNSVAFVKEHFPKVKIVVNPRNSGSGVTSNNGASIAGGEYLFFFNNDTVAFRDLIVNLVHAIEKNSSAAVAYPTQLPYNARYDEEWQKAREKGFGAYGVDIYGNPCPARKPEKAFYPDAAIFITREAFEKVGKFDPDFFLYGEDVDLCWRVHLMGYGTVFADEARFRHDSECSQIQNNRVVSTFRRRALVERQVICMMLKYYRFKTLMFLLPRFFFLWALEALFFTFLQRNFRMLANVYMPALCWNIKKFPVTLRKRRQIQSIRTVEDSAIMSRMYHGYAKLDGVRRVGIPVIQ